MKKQLSNVMDLFFDRTKDNEDFEPTTRMDDDFCESMIIGYFDSASNDGLLN